MLDDIELNEELVAGYLEQNPDFFTRHPELMTNLKLNDPNRGVISLVERQQQVLREKVQLLEEEITDLMAVANQNERLFVVYNDLYLGLIDCQNIDEVVNCLEHTVTEFLSLASVKLYLVDGKPEKVTHSDVLTTNCDDIIKARLDEEDYYFGRLSQTENEKIFGEMQVGSAMLIDLSFKQKHIGFVAIASFDAEHFDPRMDTLLISQLRALLAKLIVKLS